MPPPNSLKRTGTKILNIMTQTGENEAMNENYRALYPNPTTGFVNIRIDETFIATVYSQIGNRMLVSRSKIIDLRALPNGQYIVKIETIGDMYIQQLIKQ